MELNASFNKKLYKFTNPGIGIGLGAGLELRLTLINYICSGSKHNCIFDKIVTKMKTKSWMIIITKSSGKKTTIEHLIGDGSRLERIL